jgi:hypothetical protein
MTVKRRLCKPSGPIWLCSYLLGISVGLRVFHLGVLESVSLLVITGTEAVEVLCFSCGCKRAVS